MQSSRNWYSTAAVGAAIQLSPTGMRRAGCSLSASGFEQRRVGAHELAHRDAMDALDLRRVGDERRRGPGPDDHRRDREAGAGDVVVEAAEHGVRIEHEPDLLGELAQGRLLRRLAGVDAAAGQGPLAGMVAQARGAPGEDQGRLAAPARGASEALDPRPFAFLGDGHGHRGDAMHAGIGAAELERAEVAPDLRLERVIAKHGDPALALRGPAPASRRSAREQHVIIFVSRFALGRA